MFKDISWGNYGAFILITLVIYYITIGCLYYLNEIKQVFSGKSPLLLKLNIFKNFDPNSNNNANHSSNNVTGLESELPQYVNEYINEAKGILDHAAENNLIKQEVLYSLQQLSKKHIQINGSPFQNIINNYILANHSAVHLSKEDLNGLWMV